MAVTLLDISRKAHVSRQAVGFALGNYPHKLSAETRDRILNISREMGYRKNMAAKAVRTGRFDTVGLLYQMSGGVDIPIEVAAGMNRTLEGRNIRMTMMYMSDDIQKSPNLIDSSFCELMVDGLVLSCWGGVPSAFNGWAPTKSPVVMINTKLPNFSVYPDDRGAGRKATEYLLKLGHRRIAYADFIASGHYSTLERAKGYESAMISAGLVPRKIVRHPQHEDFIGEATRLLSEARRPTAVLAYSNHTFFPLLLASANLGIGVPRDLSLMTFDSRSCRITNATISALIHPEDAIGCAAAEMVLERIENPELVLPSVAVPFKEIVGYTCAPPPNEEHLKRKNQMFKNVQYRTRNVQCPS